MNITFVRLIWLLILWLCEYFLWQCWNKLLAPQSFLLTFDEKVFHYIWWISSTPRRFIFAAAIKLWGLFWMLIHWFLFWLALWVWLGGGVAVCLGAHVRQTGTFQFQSWTAVSHLSGILPDDKNFRKPLGESLMGGAGDSFAARYQANKYSLKVFFLPCFSSGR